VRTYDNCYQIKTKPLCNRAKLDEVELWHQKLGHVNYNMMDKLVRLDAVRGKNAEEDAQILLEFPQSAADNAVSDAVPDVVPNVVPGVMTLDTTPDATRISDEKNTTPKTPI
ncbi:Unknown protein, partial [Striga hermonthica]